VEKWKVWLLSLLDQQWNEWKTSVLCTDKKANRFVPSDAGAHQLGGPDGYFI